MIYQLRAFIGQTKVPYIELFATYRAAKDAADQLVKKCKEAQVECHGSLCQMIKNHDKYVPVTSTTTYF